MPIVFTAVGVVLAILSLFTVVHAFTVDMDAIGWLFLLGPLSLLSFARADSEAREARGDEPSSSSMAWLMYGLTAIFSFWSLLCLWAQATDAVRMPFGLMAAAICGGFAYASYGGARRRREPVAQRDMATIPSRIDPPSKEVAAPVSQRLGELAGLRDAGLVSDEDYEREKARILGDL